MDAWLVDNLNGILLVWIIGFGLGGYLLGTGKGRGIDGVVWGLSLGPIGLLVVVLLRPSRRFLRAKRSEDRERPGPLAPPSGQSGPHDVGH